MKAVRCQKHLWSIFLPPPLKPFYSPNVNEMETRVSNEREARLIT